MSVTVRYIVHDVDEAMAFYRDRLGFSEVMHPAPTFAILSRGDLRFLLSAPSGNPLELFEPTIDEAREQP